MMLQFARRKENPENTWEFRIISRNYSNGRYGVEQVEVIAGTTWRLVTMRLWDRQVHQQVRTENGNKRGLTRR